MINNQYKGHNGGRKDTILHRKTRIACLKSDCYELLREIYEGFMELVSPQLEGLIFINYVEGGVWGVPLVGHFFQLLCEKTFCLLC